MTCMFCEVSLIEKSLYLPKSNKYLTYHVCPDCDMGYIQMEEYTILMPAPRIPADGGYYMEQAYKNAIAKKGGGSRAGKKREDSKYQKKKQEWYRLPE